MYIHTHLEISKYSVGGVYSKLDQTIPNTSTKPWVKERSCLLLYYTSRGLSTQTGLERICNYTTILTFLADTLDLTTQLPLSAPVSHVHVRSISQQTHSHLVPHTTSPSHSHTF